MRRPKEQLYAGVDVGTTKVATVVARVASTGMEVVALGHAPASGMRKGLVVDAAALTDSTRRSVADAAAALGRRLPPAYVSVTGAHLASVNTGASITRASGPSRPRAFTQADTDQLVASSVPEMGASRVLLHAVPRRFEVDGHSPVHDPVGVCGETLAAETHVVSGDRVAVAELASAVRDAGVKVRGMVLQHLASASAVLSVDEREQGVVLLDVGGGTTDIAVFEDRALRHTSAIPVGGQQFTSDLAVGLGIPPEVAERVKLACGSADLDRAEARVEVAGIQEGGSQLVSRRRAYELLRDRSVELVHLVLQRVREAGLDRMPAAGLVLTGGASKLGVLSDAAARYGMCPVRVAAPSSSLTLPAELEDASFSTVVGLVLWAVQHQRAGTARMTAGSIPIGTPLREWARRLASGLHLRWPQRAPA